MPFANRIEAGQKLAALLAQYASVENVIILALPRGGVPVGAAVARSLGAPLDVFLVRKLSAPGNPELGLGALTSSGKTVLNYHVVQTYDITQAEIDEASEKERGELKRQEQLYRAGKPPLELEGKIAIVVDDGMATGGTMRAAASAVSAAGATKTIVAVPVSSESAYHDVGAQVDEIYCVETPASFEAVSQFYDDFTQLTDDQVRQYLAAV